MPSHGCQATTNPDQLQPSHRPGSPTDDLSSLGAVAKDIMRVVGDAGHESQQTQVGWSAGFNCLQSGWIDTLHKTAPRLHNTTSTTCTSPPQTQGAQFPILTAARTGQPSAAFVLSYLEGALGEVEKAVAGCGRAGGERERERQHGLAVFFAYYSEVGRDWGRMTPNTLNTPAIHQPPIPRRRRRLGRRGRPPPAAARRRLPPPRGRLRRDGDVGQHGLRDPADSGRDGGLYLFFLGGGELGGLDFILTADASFLTARSGS
jgi:hypothetical protein